MIDLCPVGALTSKPFRYSARTWELSRRKSVSPHDSLGSNLIVQVKGAKVMRVLPLENEAINETNAPSPETGESSVIIIEDLAPEDSKISVTETIVESTIVEPSEAVSASPEKLGENEIEENWDDDWEEDNESEISEVITDQSAPTMIEKAIAEIPSETPAETEEQIDPSSQISPKFAPYIESTPEAVISEEKPLFEESSTELD
jgi:hypothetical protein